MKNLSIICKVSKIVLALMALATMIGFVFLGWFQYPASVASVSNATIYANYAGVGGTQARVGIALILAALCWWIPSTPRIVKAIPLLWIIIEYLIWGADSYQIFTASENTSSYSGLLGLSGATWWDIWVGFLIVFLCICFLRRDEKVPLTRHVKSPSQEN